MWTADAVAYLRVNWATQSAAAIARKLKTTRNAVIGKAHRLDLPGKKPNGRDYTDEEIAYLRANYSRERARHIAKKIGHPIGSIYTKAHRLGLAGYDIHRARAA